VKLLYCEAVKIKDKAPVKTKLWINPELSLAAISPVNNGKERFKLLLNADFLQDWFYYTTLQDLTDAGVELGGYTDR